MNTAATTPSSTLSRAPAKAWVPWLCFLTILLDGFDTTSIGFVVPTLAREWALAPAAFTPAFVGTSAGAVLGYMLSGTMSRRFGRRTLILGAVALFALGSLATALVGTVAQLALLRLLTGIGLGAAIPACVSLAVQSARDERREAVTVAVTAGLALGATLAGVLGGRLIAQFGWSAVFSIGGLLPLLLLPMLWLGLPREDVADTPATAREAAVASLFDAGMGRNTVLLWGFSFLVFTALYALTFWVPTLLLALGFEAGAVSLGSAALGGGGFVAGLMLVPATAWLGARRVLVCTTLAAVLTIAALGKLALAPGQVLLALGLIGGFLVSGTIGQTALAVALYPPAARTTGVGWSAALGRMGSIVGPGIGGALISAGGSPREVLLWLCLPLALAVLLVTASRIGR